MSHTDNKADLASVMTRLRAGDRRGNRRAFKAAFVEFVSRGYTPKDLDDDVNLRTKGEVLGPLLKRVFQQVSWEPKQGPLVEWMEYFWWTDQNMLSWAGRFVLKRASEQSLKECVLTASRMFERAGNEKEVWRCLFLSIERELPHEIIKGVALHAWSGA